MGSSKAPDFRYSFSTGPDLRPRATRAGLWGMLFLLVLLALSFQHVPSRLGRIPILLAWSVGAVVCQRLGWIAMVPGRDAPEKRRRRWLMTCLYAAWPVWLIAFPSVVGHERFSAPSASEIADFVASQANARALLEWDEDAQGWSAVVQAMPEGPERDQRVADVAAALAPLLRDGDFVTHDTLAALTDAGVMHGDVARALLTTPRRANAPPPGNAEFEARAWLAAPAPHDLTDDREYARAAAVHDVLPESRELPQLVAAALWAGEGPLRQDHPLRGLAHLVRLADLVGVSADVPALRARVQATLLLLHRDENLLAWDGETGFVSDPTGPGEKLVDPPSTHAALELMDRFGVPEGVDLSRERAACRYRSSASFYGYAPHGVSSDHVVSVVDESFLAARWPQESAPRWQLADVLGALAPVLLLLAVRDIRRKPLGEPPKPKPDPWQPMADALAGGQLSPGLSERVTRLMEERAPERLPRE